jgi:trafficking kinesin-binding protein 1
MLSRRNSCSTFSVSMGLASVLNERGIKAVTPSAINTPSGQNFSPTVTPCNSPEATSPTRPLSPEQLGPVLRSKQFLHLEKKALRSLKLLERVENLGLEGIIQPSCRISPLALYSSNLYTSRSSPMAQLTSLRNLTEKRNSDENLKAHTSSSLTVTNNDLKSPTDPKKFNSLDRKMTRSHRQKSRRNLLNGQSAQRNDLGTVNRKDSATTSEAIQPGKSEEKSLVEGFVGSISSLLFGRKGGLL